MFQPKSICVQEVSSLSCLRAPSGVILGMILAAFDTSALETFSFHSPIAHKPVTLFRGALNLLFFDDSIPGPVRSNTHYAITYEEPHTRIRVRGLPPPPVDQVANTNEHRDMAAAAPSHLLYGPSGEDAYDANAQWELFARHNMAHIEERTPYCPACEACVTVSYSKSDVGLC